MTLVQAMTETDHKWQDLKAAITSKIDLCLKGIQEAVPDAAQLNDPANVNEDNIGDIDHINKQLKILSQAHWPPMQLILILERISNRLKNINLNIKKTNDNTDEKIKNITSLLDQLDSYILQCRLWILHNSPGMSRRNNSTPVKNILEHKPPTKEKTCTIL